MPSSKWFSRKTGLVLAGAVVGLCIGVSVRQASGETVVGPSTGSGATCQNAICVPAGEAAQWRAGNLILNTNNSYANGLLVPYGNVGVGTINPQVKLDVTGSIRASESLCIGDVCVSKEDLKAMLASAGKSGNVMASDNYGWKCEVIGPDSANVLNLPLCSASNKDASAKAPSASGNGNKYDCFCSPDGGAENAGGGSSTSSSSDPFVGIATSVSDSPTGPWSSTVCNTGSVYMRTTGVSKSNPPKGCAAPVSDPNKCMDPNQHRVFGNDEWMNSTTIRTVVHGPDYPVGVYDSYLNFNGNIKKVGSATLKDCMKYGWKCDVIGPDSANTSGLPTCNASRFNTSAKAPSSSNNGNTYDCFCSQI